MTDISNKIVFIIGAGILYAGAFFEKILKKLLTEKRSESIIYS